MPGVDYFQSEYFDAGYFGGSSAGGGGSGSGYFGSEFFAAGFWGVNYFRQPGGATPPTPEVVTAYQHGIGIGKRYGIGM